ncbi:oxidoreductase [Pararhodobacter marinus]|uniref:Oxidoreductase n=2 Tax=Pararhodobacter marinus TaxID=2184063 RepID=A0A2U2CGU2_9RHOB|nr:oxidoreductase [Pararhodobacter marinus]
MVGGGQGAFIGEVHRFASRLDGHYDLVAGALSASPDKAKASAEALNIGRAYTSYEEMAKAEAARPDGIEAVAIVTPNHVHAGPAIAFLEAGIHVICDKPLTATLDEAEALQAAVKRSKALFFLTHNYTGYPMVRQARELVESGALGKLRLVQVEYVQDWLTDPVERSGGNKQAEWRTDPARSGAGGSVGDIGTHAYNLAGFVSGLAVERLAADLDAFVEGRALDDNAHVLLRYQGGAKGMLWCSQVAPGNENGLKLRVFGDKGGLVWAQEDPNRLWFTPHGEATRLITRRGAAASAAADAVSRIPGGHPEGYLEGFANLYTGAALGIRAHQAGEPMPELARLVPGIEAGMAGMRFVGACVESSRRDAAWVSP